MFYDKTMRHIEIHLIENTHDLVLASQAGLDVYDSENCEECSYEVGVTDSKSFVPFLVLLDEESEWVVCKNCASPVL